MQNSKTLKINFIYNLISQIVTVISPLITTPYLARVLRENGNGQISYTYSIISYFLLFANLGFTVFGQREISKVRNDIERKSKVFWEIIISRSCSVVVSLLLFFSIYFLVGYGEKYNYLMIVQSLYVVAVAFDIQFLFQGEEDFKSIALRTIFIKIAGIISVFLFIKSEEDVFLYAACLAIITFLSNIVMWIGIGNHIVKVNLKNLNIFKNLKPVFIIFIPTVITTLFTTFDKSMIGWLSHNPDYDNGCYEKAYAINNLVQTLTILFSTITFPRNSVLYKAGDYETMKKNMNVSCKYSLCLAVFFAIGFLTLSKNFCSWFLGEGYYEVPTLLIIMSIRTIFSPISIELGNYFINIGKENFWLISVSVGAAVNIIGNLILIPQLGAIGATISTAATEFMIFVAMLLLCKFNNKINIKFSDVFKSFIKYAIAGAGMFLCCFFMQQLFAYSIISFVFIGCLGTIVYFAILLLVKESFCIDITKKVFSKIRKDKNNL